jgi:hypothetical protein
MRNSSSNDSLVLGHIRSRRQAILLPVRNPSSHCSTVWGRMAVLTLNMNLAHIALVLVAALRRARLHSLMVMVAKTTTNYVRFKNIKARYC